MGEVFRAKDTKLDRIVALKILPATFASDSDRVMRFTREAKTLASLNHPNIAQVYDAGREGAHAFIAMELVEGQDLSAMIGALQDQGALRPQGMSLAVALPIARQIADALATAHDAGIVHRDLKPANIKITDDSVVKVLDFGLAKALSSDDASATSDAAAATMTSPAMTAIGLILGTAAYMSPEQAKGRPVDRRADVWAFGVVLYEMLTGAPLFGREDLTETLAAVLTHEPDLSKLPPATPLPIRRLIERCLVKDKKTRLDSMSVARHELDETTAGKGGATVETRVSSRGRNPLIVAALVVSALAAGVFFTSLYYARQAPTSPDRTRVVSQIVAPDDAATAFSRGFALSPDGTTLAFSARNKSGLNRIWLRPLDSEAAHEVPGTDGGTYPFWAPDSHTLAFFADDKLKRVNIDGGSLQTVCATQGRFLMGSWSVRDEILWGSATGKGAQIHKVPAAGGTSITLDALGEANGPIWLSNGQRFIYSEVTKSPAVLRLSSADGTSSTPIPSLPPINGWDFSYGGGFLFLDRNGALTAQRLDESSGTVVGQPIPIASIAAALTTWFAVSSNGDRVIALLGRSGNATARLVWVDRQGNQVGMLGEPGPYWQLAVAPDGKSALASMGPDFQWLRPDVPPVRVTTDGTSRTNISPVWHSSGLELAYLHTPSTIIRRPLDPQGQPSVVLEHIFPGRVNAWSKDGRWLMFSAALESSATDALYLYDFTTKTQRPWLANGFNSRAAKFSPDGKWVAYESDVSGRMEIYLRAFEGEGQSIAVSADGGAHPFWRGDGAELFYLGPVDEVMSVSVTRSGSTIAPGKPRQLFRTPLNDVARDSFSPYGVSPDGQRFLLNVVDRPAPLFLLQGLATIVK